MVSTNIRKQNESHMKPTRMKPLAIDLCCGLGGWTRGLLLEGWRVVGVDIEDFSDRYPGQFVQADLLTWEGWRRLPAALVVASTPCDQFSRFGMPWTRKKNPPQPSFELWDRAFYIGRTLGVPTIQQNVRAAQHYVGRSAMNCGPFHLWGEVPAIIPVFTGPKKESYGSKQRAERAVIPITLARWIGKTMKPHQVPSLITSVAYDDTPPPRV